MAGTWALVVLKVWAGVATGVGGFSASLDIGNAPFVTVFGSVSGAATVTLQVSADGVTFYDTTSNQAATADVGFSATIAAKYVRLKSSANVTATIYIAAKGSAA
jgi:hypothetical protein